MLVQLQGREVWYLQLNEAVSRRLVELMQERGMTQYQLYMRSGVPKSTIGNLVNCAYPSMKLRIIHELCQYKLYRYLFGRLSDKLSGTVRQRLHRRQ